MRKLAAVALTAMVAGGLVAACRDSLPTNRYLQPRRSPASNSTADARGKFDHGHHAKVLAKAGVTCVDCHRFDQKIEASNADLAHALSLHGLYPGSAACHTCHGSGDGRMAGAPDACTTCHENLHPLMPENHDVAWMKVHASMAQVNSTQCEQCHRQSFCIDCHERRDTIQTRMHDRNFRFTHSVDARANPIQCGSCHRQDFCSNCHQQGKVGLP